MMKTKTFVLTADMVVAGELYKAGDTIATLESVTDLGTLSAMAGSGVIVAGPEVKEPTPATPVNTSKPTPKKKTASKRGK